MIDLAYIEERLAGRALALVGGAALILGAVFFTVRMGFINFRGFWHAVNVTRGKYDNPEDEGEVTHFQALASALSATVGLGNIAGVAIAISIGGPGATLWMIAAGVLVLALPNRRTSARDITVWSTTTTARAISAFSRAVSAPSANTAP